LVFGDFVAESGFGATFFVESDSSGNLTRTLGIYRTGDSNIKYEFLIQVRHVENGQIRSLIVVREGFAKATDFFMASHDTAIVEHVFENVSDGIVSMMSRASNTATSCKVMAERIQMRSTFA
jgi:hypothetical protein